MTVLTTLVKHFDQSEFLVRTLWPVQSLLPTHFDSTTNLWQVLEKILSEQNLMARYCAWPICIARVFHTIMPWLNVFQAPIMSLYVWRQNVLQMDSEQDTSPVQEKTEKKDWTVLNKCAQKWTVSEKSHKTFCLHKVLKYLLKIQKYKSLEVFTHILAIYLSTGASVIYQWNVHRDLIKKKAPLDDSF